MYNSNDTIVKLLLGHEAINPNFPTAKGITPLCGAVKLPNTEIARLLLEHENVSPNTREDNGQTPLWSAVKEENIAMVELLLGDEEIDPNFRNSDGSTPLCTVFATGQSVRPEPGRGRTTVCRPVRSFSKVARQVKIKDEDGRHAVVPYGLFWNLPHSSE